jgi:SAM-dependent methyltransferase
MVKDKSYLDDIYNSWPVLGTTINEALKNLPSCGREIFKGTVVDMGGGDGTALFILKLRYPEIEAICVDRNPMPLCEDVCYKEGYFDDTGLADECANVVMGISIADYFDKDLAEAFFREVNRILAPKGVVMSFDMSRGYLAPFHREGYMSLCSLDFFDSLQKPLRVQTYNQKTKIEIK